MLTPKNLLFAAAFFLLLSSGLSIANKSKVSAKIAEAAQAQAASANATSDVARAKAEQQKAKKIADDATAKLSDLQTQLSAATSQAGDLEAKFRDATGNVQAKDAQIAGLSARLLAAANAPKAAEPSAEMTKQIADLTRERDELKVVKDGFDTQLRSAQAQTAVLQQRIARRESGEALNGLRGRVLAVDRNWNFVVLDLGGRNGVNNNATMIIQRGGSLVGRVRITSVEPSQSVADIIPNSVPAGIAVQPGDTVVYSGS